MSRRAVARLAPEALDAFEARLGHRFKDRSLLVRALSHKSAGDGQPGFAHNERMEWLGDRVLGLLAAQDLFSAHGRDDEGVLTRRFHNIVSGSNCAGAARLLGVQDVLVVSRSVPRETVAANDSMLGDAYEALMAALYLDGGIEAARPLYDLAVQASRDDVVGNAKNRLQELLQKRGEAIPVYSVVGRDGPDHAPVFTVEVEAAGHKALAEGSSKQAAEQVAASRLLEMIT
ncbi:MAG: ribonuclease III [Hyphomonadaceae bacterium]|nr:ribonuclease III [Hyphomonadaceae bacterium]